MADIDVTRKSGAQYTWILILLAVLSVAGLMWWLAAQAETTNLSSIVSDSATVGPDAAGVSDAEMADLAGIAAAPETYMDRRVQLENVQVAATLGPSAFWADIPGANPFLVLFSPNVNVNPGLAAGQTLRVAGAVAPVTDSLLTVWVESGAINAGAREEAAFATHYLLADQILSQGSAAPQ